MISSVLVAEHGLAQDMYSYCCSPLKQIEIDLGPSSRYHSIFACPILRQQSTESNPPMRLTCGHVISRDALNKLTTSAK